MRSVTLSTGVVVRPFRDGDAPAMLRAVDATRDRLARWMPWVPHATEVDSFEAFMRDTREREEDGSAFDRGLFDGDTVVGGIGARVDLVNQEAEVGYWVAPEWEGRGVVTEAVVAMLSFLFDDYEVHRVVIRAAVGNVRSRAIPERLGFTFEGILRQSLLLEGLHHDAAIYSMLEDEWRASRR